MKWGTLIMGTIMAIGLGLWMADIGSDRSHKLEVLELITLFKDAPQDYPMTNFEAGKILPAEAVKVLRMGYGKDFRAWKVKGSKGQEGWFIENGKNVRIIVNRRLETGVFQQLLIKPPWHYWPSRVIILNASGSVRTSSTNVFQVQGIDRPLSSDATNKILLIRAGF